MVREGRISLQVTAYVELHAWLATAARTGAEVDPALETARLAYARSLRDDDEDLLLERTARALSACAEDRCSSTAVASEGFGHAYNRALPHFVARTWADRASAAWVGLEASRAVLGAIGPAADAIFTRAASDLGLTWPDGPVPISVVSEAPPVGRSALAPVALATRGRCFFRDRATSRGADERVDRARILDCLLVHALSAVQGEDTALAGLLHDTLVRELGPRDGERAWSLLIIHSAATIVSGWEPKHRSVHRRSAEAVELSMLDWLAKEWRGARAEALDAFAARYAARWREVHPAKE